jgi:hypothetical protein
MTQKTNRPTSSSRKTAADEYARVREDILDRMVLIRRLLDRHEDSRVASPRNWGFVGDLTYIDQKLSEIQGAMTSTEDGTRGAETGVKRSTRTPHLNNVIDPRD